MRVLSIALLVGCSGCLFPLDGGESGCAGATPTFSGQLQTDVGNVSFDTIEVTVHHGDEGTDAGCVTEVSFVLWVGSQFDCSLQVDAGGALDDQGRLAVTSVALTGLGCPEFPAELDGLYQATDLTSFGVVFGGGVTNPADTVDACFETYFELELDGTLEKMALGDGAPTLDLTGTRVRVEGPVPSIGEPGPCPS